ncbi:hypothetical protein LXL04_006879 [Taraxacum kok-saghyz]
MKLPSLLCSPTLPMKGYDVEHAVAADAPAQPVTDVPQSMPPLVTHPISKSKRGMNREKRWCCRRTSTTTTKLLRLASSRISNKESSIAPPKKILKLLLLFFVNKFLVIHNKRFSNALTNSVDLGGVTSTFLATFDSKPDRFSGFNFSSDLRLGTHTIADLALIAADCNDNNRYVHMFICSYGHIPDLLQFLSDPAPRFCPVEMQRYKLLQVIKREGAEVESCLRERGQKWKLDYLDKLKKQKHTRIVYAPNYLSCLAIIECIGEQIACNP